LFLNKQPRHFCLNLPSEGILFLKLDRRACYKSGGKLQRRLWPSISLPSIGKYSRDCLKKSVQASNQAQIWEVRSAKTHVDWREKCTLLIAIAFEDLLSGEIGRSTSKGAWSEGSLRSGLMQCKTWKEFMPKKIRSITELVWLLVFK